VKIQFVEMAPTSRCVFVPNLQVWGAMHQIISLCARLLYKINPASAPHFAAHQSRLGSALCSSGLNSRRTASTRPHYVAVRFSLASTGHCSGIGLPHRHMGQCGRNQDPEDSWIRFDAPAAKEIEFRACTARDKKILLVVISDFSYFNISLFGA
jgi:hypothetical protein